MLRWDQVDDVEVYDATVKMYRPPYEASKFQTIDRENKELDHYAHDYLGSELDMYKILDSNWITYMEERGDIQRLDKIKIPIADKYGFSV